MAKFKSGGNNVTNSSVDGMSVSDFMDSETYLNMLDIFDLPQGTALEVRLDGSWEVPDEEHVIDSSDQFRFATSGGTKG